MARPSEEISKSMVSSAGKPDCNLSNDTNNLGGIPAEEYATKQYVQKYHDNKELSQKEYIDAQDKKILEEAKEHANSLVRNQDFSEFAKVSDVQSLDEKLQKQITQGDNNQKEYTDGRIQGVVNDVNSNFDDVNGTISKLNGTVNDLFQSVSDGKSKIAEAITDKGVATSANDSFDTMSNNIRNIQTSGGGGETDPNFVNTGDATAIASDILLGKTAYAKGDKVYGTLIAQAEEGYPTYGTDTSDATATSSDLMYGKTAYARGQKLVGTALPEIEEVYGVNDNVPYTIKHSSMGISRPPDGFERITFRNNMKISPDGNYCVSWGVGETTNTKYVESLPINDDGIYYLASSGITGEATVKKFRYTFEELGLIDSEGEVATEIYDLALGCPGLGGSSNKCVLAIAYGRYYKDENNLNRHFFGVRLLTYHLSENGVIGKEFDTETNIVDDNIVWTNNNNDTSELFLVASNNNPLSMFVLDKYTVNYFYIRLGKIKIEENISLFDSKIYWNEIKKTNSYVSYSSDFKITSDDKYVHYNVSDADMIFRVDEGDIPSDDLVPNNFYVNGIGNIVYYNNQLYIISVYNDFLYIYKLNIIGNTAEATLLKQIKLKNKILSTNTYIQHSLITADIKKIIAIAISGGASSIKSSVICVYDVDTVFSTTESEIEAEQSYAIPFNWSYDGNKFRTFSNINSTRLQLVNLIDIENQANMYTLTNSLDTNNLIGIKYKNQFFGKIQPELLTAGQGDVRTGKTFIGWMGYPEVGTMEV